MKVTKIIKEYIEEKIDAKYDPIIEAIEAKYASKNDEYNEVVTSVRNKLETYARNEFRKALAKFYTPEGLEELIPTDIQKRRDLVNTPYTYNSHTKHAEMLDKELKTIRAKRDNAIKNILITLELGGTKADLDRMLSEINPEEE